MNDVAVDITTLLHTNGLGVLGTDLFASEWGDGIDAQTLILGSGGSPTGLKDQYAQLFFQVLVRGANGGNITDTYTIIKSIHDFLIAQDSGTIINSVSYLGFEVLSEIGALGRDENNRFMYSANYYTYRNAT